MDFSKRGTSERLVEANSISGRFQKKIAVSLFFAFFTAIVFLGIIGLSAGYGFYQSIIDISPEVSDIDVSPVGYATKVYDRNGKEIQKLVTSGSNRILCSIENVPQDLIDAFVAIEDERFWTHEGIDIKGIFRALYNGVQNNFDFDQGASTLTQQLLKNNVFSGGAEHNHGDRIIRKIQEQYLSVQLETKLTKEVILEDYLNTINLGANTLGVQAASHRYFDKDVSELTLSECAVIAAITQSPYSLNPITNPSKNADRREKILRNMYNQDKISKEEWDEALADNVYDRIQNVNITISEESNSPYSYFVDEVIRSVISDLKKKLGYTDDQARKLLYSGGLKIYSTMDPAVQAVVDEEVNDPENYLNSNKSAYLDALTFTYQMTVTHADGTTTNYSEGHIKQYYHTQRGMTTFQLSFDHAEEIEECIAEFETYIIENGQPGDTIWGHNYNITLQPQVSMVIMEQHTGQIAAIIGGRGEKTTSLSLNRATQSTRQPGSTFKVLAAFAPALESGATLATTYYDEPFDYYGGTVSNWWRNRNGDYYGGYGSIREAIIYSSNILATRCLVETISPELAMVYLDAFGFTTLDPSKDVGYSLALGGIYNGVSNLELTAAYSSIANGGIYTEPVFYTKILDNNGKVLLTTEPQTHRVLNERTAWLLADAMKDETKMWSQIYKSEAGERTVFNSSLDMNFGDMYVAGKSGTTTSTKDIWFTGFTPYYTCTIWSGYDDSSSMENLNTGGYHRKIWRNVMERINDGKENIGYPMPSGIVEVEVCSISGKLPIEGVCDHDPEGSCIITEYFSESSVPTEYCDKHITVNVCDVSGQAAGAFCPAEETYGRIFRILPSTNITADSDFGLPQDYLNGNVCYIHSGGYYPEGENLWWIDTYVPAPPEEESAPSDEPW